MDLTDEQDIYDRFPCRSQQIQQLKLFLTSDLPSPPALIVHGPESTGKSTISRTLLSQNRNINHAFIKCQESITGRHLLERTIQSCTEAVAKGRANSGHHNGIYNTKCESLNALCTQLQSILKKSDKKFVLLFDSIDRQRDAPPTLLAALVRTADMIPNLTIVFSLRIPPPVAFHRPGIPSVYFPAYARADLIHILSLRPSTLPSNIAEDLKDATMDDKASDWLYMNFLPVAHSALGRSLCATLPEFSHLCSRLWPVFASDLPVDALRKRDFARIMIAKRSLFQNENLALSNALADSSSLAQQQKGPAGTVSSTRAQKPQRGRLTAILSPTSNHLLLSAYLASHTTPRQDSALFMKSSAKKKRRRKTRAPTSSSSITSAKLPRRLQPPSSFPIERLLAIYQAISPWQVRGSGVAKPGSGEVYARVAEMSALGLLSRVGGRDGDVLDLGGKWRVGVGWGIVEEVGKGIGFDIGEWVGD